MKLALYQPWASLNRLHDELERMLEMRAPAEDESLASVSYWTPAVDIKEETDRFLVRADVPGVDPKDIEITLENGVLTLRGERKQEKKESGAGWSRVERVHGAFYRRLGLPNTGDAEAVKARVDHGVLEVEIPKRKEMLPRKIPVNG